MNKNQERSFIARLYCDAKKLCFFKTSTTTLLTTEETRGPTAAYDPDTGEWVPLGRGQLKSTILVHFWCYEDYYNLQIMSEDYKYLSKDKNGRLGAFPAAGSNTTSFNLLNSAHKIITLDDMKGSRVNVYLKARHSKVIRKSTWEYGRDKYYCFTGDAGDIALFNLEILERNVVTAKSLQHYG